LRRAATIFNIYENIQLNTNKLLRQSLIRGTNKKKCKVETSPVTQKLIHIPMVHASTSGHVQGKWNRIIKWPEIGKLIVKRHARITIFRQAGTPASQNIKRTGQSTRNKIHDRIKILKKTRKMKKYLQLPRL